MDGIQIAYETFGDPKAEAMVLLSGLGGEMRDWSEEAISQITREEFFVIRMDHRDSGASSEIHMPVDVISAFLGSKAAAPYSISDMAQDVKAVLDHLDVSSAHIVGASMGAMVAQQFCIEYPGSVRTLCSIMSTTGAKDVGQPSSEIVAAVLNGVAPDFQGIESLGSVESKSAAEAFSEIDDLDQVKESIAKTTSSTPNLERILRQLAAVFVSGDRTHALRAVKVPTVVIHGDADPVVDVSGGVATYQAIAGSKLVIVPGMVHEVRPEHWPLIRDALLENAKASR